jgi:hypothetical protein
LVSSRGDLIQIYLSSANIANLFWPAENLLKKKIVTPLLLEPTPECDATPMASCRCKLTSLQRPERLAYKILSYSHLMQARMEGTIGICKKIVFLLVPTWGFPSVQIGKPNRESIIPACNLFLCLLL